MSLLDKIKAQIMALIDTANAKTGKTDTDLTTAVTSLVDGYGSVGNDFYKYMSNFTKVFENATFPSGYVLNLELPNFGTSSVGSKIGALSNAFLETKGLKKVSLKLGNIVDKEVDVGSICRNAFDLEEIDFHGATIKSQNFYCSFDNNIKLKKINCVLDLSVANNVSYMLGNTKSLEYVRFLENSIRKTISFKDSLLLSNESIQSIINGLATVETSQTLTLHADVKAKLTDEQIATITSKNWTLA